MDRANLNKTVELVRRANKERDTTLKMLRLELSNIEARLNHELTSAKDRAETARKAVLEQIAMLEYPGPCE